MRRAIAVLLLAWSAQEAAADAPKLYTEDDVRAVVDLIEARLALMPEVARYKRRHGLPIEDLQREQVVIKRARQRAAEAGIDPESVHALFRAQIEAAKDIQRRTPPPAEGMPVADLERDLRPALIEIGERLIERLSLALPDLGRIDTTARQRLRAAGLDRRRAEEIAAALREVRGLPVTSGTVLDRVIGRGVLKVGTTGDYAPFSELCEGRMEGIDIDLAIDLARRLGVKLVLVQTTWPDLLEDLAHDRFDIAMSGISRNLSRARHGLLSAPYHRGGKMPIARCSDAARYRDIEAIDRPGTRVLVNPGGTNEQFVRANLSAATIVVIDDNREIFARLVAGDGDVMITDQIEVRLQSRRHPELCATREQPFTVQTKGFLLPRDPIWRDYVNLWLEMVRGEGRLATIFNRYLH